MNRRGFFQSAAGLWLAIQEPVRTYSFIWGSDPLIGCVDYGTNVTVGENGGFLNLKSASEWLWKRGGGTAIILPGHYDLHEGASLCPGDRVTYEKVRLS